MIGETLSLAEGHVRDDRPHGQAAVRNSFATTTCWSSQPVRGGQHRETKSPVASTMPGDWSCEVSPRAMYAMIALMAMRPFVISSQNLLVFAAGSREVSALETKSPVASTVPGIGPAKFRRRPCTR
eukprot:12542380-Heterocapsa_arctica.AAC.1